MRVFLVDCGMPAVEKGIGRESVTIRADLI